MDDHEHLLADVLGVGVVDAEPPQGAPDEGRMLDEELLERRRLRGSRGNHAGRVGARGGERRHALG